MGRLGKVLLVLVIVAAAVGGGAIGGLRAGRGKVGAATQIKPGLYSVTNAGGIYLFAARVAPGPNVIVFDAGMDPEGRPIDALLQTLQASRDDVSDLFLTHGHFDHVSGAHVLGKAKVHLGSGDVGLATGVVPPEALIPRLVSKAMGPVSMSVNAPLAAAAAIPVGPPDAAGGAKTVKAYPVPGHTPGSFAFLYDGVLFAGDIMIFKQGRLDPTPRLLDPNPEANKASIKSLKTQLAGETIDRVCTAHGDGCTPKGLGGNLLKELIERI
jgi:glyoxylase-like metal-dependent hydrolase (beta-lactamase superfamily II)